MFHKRNCGSYSVSVDLFLVLFCFVNLPVTDCAEMGTVSPLKSSISIWFGVNTFYLGGVSLIQYYVFLCLISRLCLLTYYEFGLTEYHCMSLILGINWKTWYKCFSGQCVRMMQVESLRVMFKGWKQEEQLRNGLQFNTELRSRYDYVYEQL